MWLRLTIVLSIIALAEYYSFILIRSSLRSLPSAWKITFTALYLLLTALSWSGFIFFRQINWASIPHLLRNIYIAFVLGFTIGKILVMLVMLIDDLRRLITWFIQLLLQSFTSGSSANSATKGLGISRSEFLSKLALALGGASVVAFIYGVTNRYNYQVRRIKLQFAELPSSFKGLKILQLSDIHTGSFDSHQTVATGIQKALNEKPDIILFTGDLVNNHSIEVDASYREIFSKLKAPMGVYSILGNHDYGDYVQWPSKEAKHQNLEQLKNIQADMGWRLLMNEHIVLERGQDKIALIGIENWSAKANFTRYGNLAKAYAGLPEKNIPFKILMSHDPSHWDAQVKTQFTDIQLTLSGHTHGMQFGVESKWLKWSPVKYMYSKWAGLYTEGKQHLYVNRGFGFLGYPGRLGILPEITVIELA